MTIDINELEFEDLIIDKIYRSNGNSNASGDVLCKLMSVGSMGGFRKRKKINSSQLAYIVLESTQKQIDWIDEVNIETGNVVYFGDNRTPGHDLHDTSNQGNKILRDAFNLVNSNTRDEIPPFFYFESAGGRDRRFIGLLVPGDFRIPVEDQLIAIWRNKDKERYQNYKATFTILNESRIDKRWLLDLRSGVYKSKYTPKTWLDWQKTGIAKPLMSKRVVSYRNRSEQLPISDFDLEQLKIIFSYFTNKYNFEKCAIKIVEMMDRNIHNCQHTRFVKDGGRDAVGLYRIGQLTDGIDVEFSLEAKCYNPDSSEVGVKDMSRLISRLKFRQFGILVTTSSVGKQAYMEVKEDQHPIVIISGGDIVKILYNAGIKTKEELKTWLQQFDC